MASKVRTYSRAANKDQLQQKVDEGASKSAAGLNPIKAEKSKWGDTSFVRVREDDPFEVTYKKVKVENETVDPFTFDLEEDGSVVRVQPANNAPPPNLPSKGLGRPAIPTVKLAQRVNAAEEEESVVDVRTENVEEDLDDEPTLLKRPVRTYSRGAKKDANSYFTPEDSVTENVEADSMESDPLSQKSDIFSTPEIESKNVFDDDDEDGDMTVNKSGSRRGGAQRTYSRRGKHIPKEGTKITSKTHILQSEDDDAGGPTVLNFRSSYMDPAVYSNFKYTPQEEDPVGRMNNSKVLQSSEIKHGKGSTLIVICSPKPPAEGKQTLHPVKTYKVKGRKIHLVEEEDGQAPQPTPPRQKRETKVKEPAPTRAKRPRRGKKPDYTEEEEEIESTQEQATPVSVGQQSQPVPVSLHEVKPQRINKIFRSRNKGADDAKETSSQSTDLVQAAAMDSQIQQDVQEFDEPSVAAENLEQGMAVQQTSEDDMFGFGSEKPAEAPTLQVENVFTSQESDGTYSSQGTVQDASKDTEKMDTEEPVTDSQEEEAKKPSQNVKPKATRVTALKEEEGEVDSGSSEGEFDSSQEFTDSQNSTGDSKGSGKDRKFFKSKSKAGSAAAGRKIFQSPKKSPSKAKYNVRSWQEDIDEEDRSKKGSDSNGSTEGGPPTLVPVTSSSSVVKPAPPSMDPPKLTRAVHWPDKLGDEAFTSVHVNKEHKQLYTVVRNVKEAHECQEHGETQDFSDDIDYLLAGVMEKEPMSTRCLSCIGLAQKSILPAFRMHLRAHGTVAKIFGNLQDAVTDPSLALCTALLMFMLSQDKLNMDLDRQSLDLMLKLLEVDLQEESSVTVLGKRTLNRNKDRAKEVYEQWRAESGSTQSEMEDVSTGNLAMESLLSLTSRRAGEWFKEELRTLGALDHIIDTVCSCIEALDEDTTLLTDSAIENLKKTDRCLRVLENVSYVNTENQSYLISYKTGALLVSLCRALSICEKFLPVYPIQLSDSLESVDKNSTGYIIYSCVLAVLRVLLNITHENEFGCTKVGDQMGFISTVLTCILQTPQYVPLDFRFDLLVLSLGLLINMVEHCTVNRRKLMDAQTLPCFDLQEHIPEMTEKIPATKALVEVFCKQFELAKLLEEEQDEESTTPQQSPNKSGEWKESDSGIEWVANSASKKTPGTGEETPLRLRPSKAEDRNNDADDEDTFTKALHRAGKHMENSIVASYVALLLGCLIQDNMVFVSRLKDHLPDESFDDMILMLRKFLSFMNLTTAVGSTGGKSISHVIEVLEGC